MIRDESWKEIPSCPGYYVSIIGEVYGPSGKLLKPEIDMKGYLRFTTFINGKRKHKRIHRVVLEAFVGPCAMMVDHINGIRHDNRLENLRYVSAVENAQHKKVLGTQLYGECVHFSRLTEVEVNLIRRDFVRISAHNSNALCLSKRFKVSHKTILDVVNGNTWKHLIMDSSNYNHK